MEAELEKLREEKRELELRKAVNDRFQERLGAGWRKDHALALGQLEWAAGGEPLTLDDVSRLRQDKQYELSAIEQKVDRLLNDNLRLRRAEPIMAKRDKAALEVERLKSPMATVKRWFSGEARKEFQTAQMDLDRWNAEASMEGVFSREDLNAQKAALEEKMAEMPDLDKRAEGIKEVLGRASLAVEGFQQEQARARERTIERGRALDDLAWERQRSRERARGMDRGR
jgi:uncharacterized protein YukE